MNNITNYQLAYKRKYGGDNMCTVLAKIRNKEPYELLSEYNISFDPPIDLSQLLDNIGISTIAKDFAEIEKLKGVPSGSILGAAFSNNNDLAIFYKKSDSLHRKKFTIAHELAHCCLDCPTDESSHIQYRTDNTDLLPLADNLKKEERANIFAGKLLIPKKTLITYYNKLIIPSLTELAKIFDVSISVMAARLDYLRIPYYKDSFR